MTSALGVFVVDDESAEWLLGVEISTFESPSGLYDDQQCQYDCRGCDPAEYCHVGMTGVTEHP